MEHLSKNDIGTFRVACISSVSMDILRADLSAAGFDCYFLDSNHIRNKESFLGELAKACSLNHDPTVALTSWDAASDILWQRLMEQPKGKVAVIWRDAHLLLDGRLQLLLDSLELLLGVADIVERQEATLECHPVLLRVVLTGQGCNFLAWSRDWEEKAGGRK